MEVVFDTDNIAPAKRFAAWQEAICECYVRVDVEATRPEQYKGYVREASFGDIMLTDIFVSEQRIRRNAQHIARLDKDCYYLQLLQRGGMNVLQHGEDFLTNPARGGLFCATEQYELQCIGDVRSFYLEIPRDAFSQRFPKDRVPLSHSISSTRGVGAIATEFCATLAAEGSDLSHDVRAELGHQLMDLLALAVLADEDDIPGAEGSVRNARLRTVQNWIEAHISDHDLSLEKVAHANMMSLRYLHLLFKKCNMSASEWMWSRRLELCYDEIAKSDGRSITSIAFNFGFSSSAHFSTAFRRKYGFSPREVSRGPR